MTLIPAEIHSGDHASPEARNAALKISMPAKAILKKDNQRILSVAIARVSSSSPKTPAIEPANKKPSTATKAASEPPSTSDAMVTRLASS